MTDPMMSGMSKSMTEYVGVTHFHSETGTEGGFWAFQDERFMHLTPPNHWHCKKCGRVWDKDSSPDTEPPPFYTYWIDRSGETTPEGYRILSGYMRHSEWHDDLPLGPPGSDLDWKWTLESNKRVRECSTEGHDWESPEEQWPDGTWSYEGLKVLGNGDELIVYDIDDPTKELWHGIIDLEELGLFTDDAHGFWIHADQKGIDRDLWATFFLEQHPAKLIRTE